MVVGVPSCPAALVRSRVSTVSTVGVFHIAHRILHEIVVHLYLHAPTQEQTNIHKALSKMTRSAADAVRISRTIHCKG